MADDTIGLDKQIAVVRTAADFLFGSIQKGLHPTFYQTMTYEGDVRLKATMAAAIVSLERLKEARELLDAAFIRDDSDMRYYDEHGVNQAHRVLSGGDVPRETKTEQPND